MKQVADVA
ncbi:hypothetical protein ECEC4448_2170, partial [Escherichia coli EC4448]